ncbi:MAG: WD40 repeat domain-containing protein [Candidatus Poseidoniales archaeon]|nr:MAG: WD40 repeat domain-containing protein [Candidatus Poseidoniales archaeon]|tara:strand:- start:8355 stop:10778 length:2424 start_codon:yes stop_codon:yes gene_type:complete
MASRACSILLAALMLGSLGTVSGAAGDIGYAGEISTLSGSSIGWADLGNGQAAIVNESGNLTVMEILGQNAGNEVWTGIINVSALSLAHNPTDGVIAVGHNQGAAIYSTVFESIIYSISAGPVDALSFDADGDLWITNRLDKRASEYSNGVATGAMTTAHSIGITSIEVTPQGDIITGGRDRTLRVHQGDGAHTGTLIEPNSEVTDIMGDSNGLVHAITKDGLYLAYNSSDWNLSHSMTPSPPGDLVSLHDIDADRIALGGAVGLVHLVNRSTGASEQTLNQGNGEVVGILGGEGDALVVLMSFASSSDIMLFDIDTDGDGIVDSIDAFPSDSTQTTDRDGDGYGDLVNGNNSDRFPDDSTQWVDQDNDGYGDNPNGTNPDLFPQNSDQHKDTDGDGYGDASYGLDGDRYPTDATQWADSDGDGYGDNLEGNNPDACPNMGGQSSEDRLGCPDMDADGWSDEGDYFPDEPTQWADSDMDGYGDAQQGYRGDGCANQAGTSTRYLLYDPAEDRVKTVSTYGCPDSDGDGYADESEAYWDADNCPGSLVGNATEWLDEDRDCLGSNTDYDDREFNVQTIEDYCERNENESACVKLNQPVYTPINDTNSESDPNDFSAQILKFAPYGVGIGIAMMVIIGILGMLGRRVTNKSSKEDEYVRKGATKEIETGSIEQVGGIIEDDAWGEDVAALLDMSDTSSTEDAEDAAPQGKSRSVTESDGDESSDSSESSDADVDDGSGEWQEGEQGWQVYDSATSDSEAEQEAPSEAPTTEEAAPTEAPPLPEGGLPPGWTTDQWKWYGHEWLEKNGGQ